RVHLVVRDQGSAGRARCHNPLRLREEFLLLRRYSGDSSSSREATKLLRGVLVPQLAARLQSPAVLYVAQPRASSEAEPPWGEAPAPPLSSNDSSSEPSGAPGCPVAKFTSSSASSGKGRPLVVGMGDRDSPISMDILLPRFMDSGVREGAPGPRMAGSGSEEGAGAGAGSGVGAGNRVVLEAIARRGSTDSPISMEALLPPSQEVRGAHATMAQPRERGWDGARSGAGATAGAETGISRGGITLPEPSARAATLCGTMAQAEAGAGAGTVAWAGMEKHREPPMFVFEGGQLCAAMHELGINLRYLPLLCRSLPQEQEGVRQLACAELASRAAKHILACRLRDASMVEENRSTHRPRPAPHHPCPPPTQGTWPKGVGSPLPTPLPPAPLSSPDFVPPPAPPADLGH
ncbi:unnamed protein product, partial [Discosporangium mesarthrocarpum]